MLFDRKAFAANIRAERARLGISQEETARRAGISPDALVKYESDNGYTPGIDKVCALANVFGTDPNSLIGYTDNRATHKAEVA